MFRKPKKKNPKAKFRSIKKRRKDEDENDNLEGAAKRRFRRSADSNGDGDGDGDSDGDGNGNGDGDDSARNGGSESESESQLLQQIKDEQKRKNQRIRKSGSDGNNKKLMHEYKSTDASKLLSDKDFATATAQHHPEEQEQQQEQEQEQSNTQKQLYKGNKETRNKFLAGPIKAPTFVRTTSRFDYQPDICKDFKETGFCGFGDSCIYLHDRTNTLNGWQLEQEYEKRKKAEQMKKEKEMDLFCRQVGTGRVIGIDNGNDIDNDNGNHHDDGIPFACFLCRKYFKQPVVTACAHYYCQDCIMDYTRNNNNACAICQKDTFGVFNYPTKLVSKKRRMIGSSGTWDEFALKNAANTS